MILIIYILAAVGSFLIGLFTNHYYPNYMKFKAKNLATKEDIGDITTIVESIKTDLSKDVETLKAELSLLNQNKISLKSEERKELLDFHLKYSLWHNSIIYLSTPNSIDDINNIFTTWKDLEADYKTAESMLELFVDDKNFITLKFKLYSSISETLELATNFLFSIKRVLLQYESNKLSFAPEEAVQKFSDHLSERSNLSEKFRSDLLESSPGLLKLNFEMTMALKNLLFTHNN